MMCYCVSLSLYIAASDWLCLSWGDEAFGPILRRKVGKTKKMSAEGSGKLDGNHYGQKWSSFITFNFLSFFFLISALCRGALVLCYVLLVILLSLCIAAGCPSFHCLYQFFLILMNFQYFKVFYSQLFWEIWW